MTETHSEIVYFVYDGECPLCQLGASFYKVREVIGELELVDARTEKDHPVMQEVNAAKLNLDEGMVLKYQGQLYQGVEALYLMAKLGADEGVLNRLNNTLYKSKTLAKMHYPFMRGVRNLMLKAKGVKKIQNLEAK